MSYYVILCHYVGIRNHLIASWLVPESASISEHVCHGDDQVRMQMRLACAACVSTVGMHFSSQLEWIFRINSSSILCIFFPGKLGVAIVAMLFQTKTRDMSSRGNSQVLEHMEWHYLRSVLPSVSLGQLGHGRRSPMDPARYHNYVIYRYVYIYRYMSTQWWEHNYGWENPNCCEFRPTW